MIKRANLTNQELIAEKEKSMKVTLIRGKILFVIFILLLVFGCSYNMSNTQYRSRSGPDCNKFYSEWTEIERVQCGL
jgi:hypothetical protein